MEHRTLVAIFGQHGEAEQALQALANAGYSDGQARLTEASAAGDVTDDSIANVNARRPDFEESISERLADLLGSSDDDAVPSEAVRRRSCVLSVDVASDDECERAEVILKQFHPEALDQRETMKREHT